MTAAFAQDVAEADTIMVARRTAKAKKNYPVKSVSGIVTDDATGQPMGGVRVQALGLEAYSTLTEEDGSYKLDIPTFSDVLLITVEDYNPLQVVVKDGRADARLLTGHFTPTYTSGTIITSQNKMLVDESSSITVETDMQNRLAGDVYTLNRSGVPGMGMYMQIRGVNSINASAQPLIILDGNMIDPQYDRTTLHEGFYNNSSHQESTCIVVIPSQNEGFYNIS